MQEAVGRRHRAAPGGSRPACAACMSASMAIHVGMRSLVVLVVPKDWLGAGAAKAAADDDQPRRIAAANKSGGMVAAGARPVEQVAPPPKRPEPIPPATPPKAGP